MIESQFIFGIKGRLTSFMSQMATLTRVNLYYLGGSRDSVESSLCQI